MPDRPAPQLDGPPPRPPAAWGVILPLAGLKLALHLAVNLLTAYEFHRDELLYLAMGNHLRLWRMDFPPLIAILAEAVRAVAGSSLFAIRLVPALAGTALVVLAGLLARELGGRRFAQGLAALTVLASPLFLRAANLFQPVVLDQLWWTLGLFALLRWCRTGEPRWWILLGLAGGVGLLSKFSIFFFGAAALAGILLTRERRVLLTRWPWLALGLALLLGSPSLTGQVLLDFPVAGQMDDLREVQLERVGAAGFLVGQLLLGPAVALALAGLVGLSAEPVLRPFRLVGLTCLAAFVLLAALEGKPYYVGPAYPTLFAAGAVLLERVPSPRLGAVLRRGAVGVIVLYGLYALPFGVPMLAPPVMARYAALVGPEAALRTNTGELEALPQDYADMLGWREEALAVAAAYRGLSPPERADAVLFGQNYGQAGALDLYGPGLGLPPVVSLAGSFYFFGPGERPGRVIVTLGVSADGARDHCGRVEEAGIARNRWGVAEEREVPVLVCRDPVRSLRELWRERGPHD